MPAHKSAVKQLKQDARRQLRNSSVKSSLKTLRKELLAHLPANKAEAKKLFPDMQSALDKAAKRGVIHRNKAARLKSRLAIKLAQ
jgi:small subunit ribosomal protein S20